MSKPEKPTKPVFTSSADNLTLDRLIKTFKLHPDGWRVNLNPVSPDMPTIERYDATQAVAQQQFYFNRKSSAEDAAKFLGITETV